MERHTEEPELVDDRFAGAANAARPVRRASDLKYTDLDFEQELPQLPTPEPEKETEPETPQITSLPAPAAPPPPVVNIPSTKTASPEPIPASLSWVLGFMALLLLLVAIGMVLCEFWDCIPMSMRVASLVAIPEALWLVYILGFNRGYRAPELAALLTAISWLDSVIIYQLCIQSLPLWVAASVLTFGMLLIPTLRPWRMGVSAALISGVLQLALMAHALFTARTYGEWALIWAAALAMVMIWSHIGVWCALTTREGYRPFSILGPIAQILFLVMLITMLVYPQHLMPEGISEHGSIAEWLGIIVVWGMAMLPVFPLQKHYADISNHPTISHSFLLYWGISLLTVPLGLLLAWYSTYFLVIPLILMYLFSMVYYGAEYRVPRFVIMGSIGIFLSLVGIPYNVGTGLIGSAIILFALAGVFFFALLWLNAYRKRLVTRKREEAARNNGSDDDDKPKRRYSPPDKVNIDLPDYD